jgi:hypothetical protein
MAEESDESVNTDHDTDGEVTAMVLADVEDSFVEAHAQIRFLQKGAARGDDATVPEAGIFFHRISLTAHMVHAADAQRSACGMKMSNLIYEFAEGPYALDGCALCWRPGCCQWVAGPAEELLSEVKSEPRYSPTSVVSCSPADDLCVQCLSSDEDDGF